MFVMLSKISILLSVLAITQANECDKIGTLLYEDLGCIPQIDEATNCPTKYDCGTLARNGDSCKLGGRSYTVGQRIDKELTAPCNVACFCGELSNEEKQIQCAVVDCFFGPRDPNKKDCYPTYKLGDCCQSGEICPPFDNITKCEVDGTTYMEGQKFWPKGMCMDCVCDKGFDGKFEAPFCKRTMCNAEIRHADDIKKNCAPVYFVKADDALCCPSAYICPSDEDVYTTRKDKATHNNVCKYGDKEVNAEQQIERKLDQWGKVRDVKCVCDLPPFLTCTATD